MRASVYCKKISDPMKNVRLHENVRLVIKFCRPFHYNAKGSQYDRHEKDIPCKERRILVQS